MKIQTLGWLIGAVALASAGSFIACSQAAVQCTVGHAGAPVNLGNGLVNGYAAKFVAQGTAPACAQKGDIVGFESYHEQSATEDKQPDYAKPTIIALQAAALADLASAKGSPRDEAGEDPGVEDTNAEHKLFGLGPFGTLEPDTTSICVVPKVTTAEQDFPARDAIAGMGGGMPEIPAEPATKVSYEWTNLKMFVTAAVPGTQFTADLHYTQDTCTVDYKVIGSWPAVPCDDGAGVAVDALCCPEADPNGGRPTGSGINPDFPMKCDPDLLLCVLDTQDATKLPVLKPGWAADADGVPSGVCKLTPLASSTSTGM